MRGRSLITPAERQRINAAHRPNRLRGPKQPPTSTDRDRERLRWWERNRPVGY